MYRVADIVTIATTASTATTASRYIVAYSVGPFQQDVIHTTSKYIGLSIRLPPKAPG